MKWSEDELKEIVKNKISVAECLRALGLMPLGSNYKTFKKYMKLYNIDTSHFLGQAHLTGKTRSLPKRPLVDSLVENSALCPSALKKRLLKENLLDYKCSRCEISTWINEPLVLHLDHINGVNDDHRISNLRLLCPNCHSQTDTYCGKNAIHLNSTAIKNNKCPGCSKSIGGHSTWCTKCSITMSPNQIKTHQTKIVWPEHSQLQELVDELGYSGTARQLGVSDKAVKNRLKRH